MDIVPRVNPNLASEMAEIYDFAGLRGIGALLDIPGDRRSTLIPKSFVPLSRSHKLSKLDGPSVSTKDHSVFLASVRCWTIHAKLAKELDSDAVSQNDLVIDELGAERCRSVSYLAHTQSKGLEGIQLKKNILMFVHASYEESALLLRSCLDDCDRVLSQDRIGSIDHEPKLALAVGNFIDTMNQLKHASSQYDECDDDNKEAERSGFFAIMENLAVQFEATIHAVATQPAETLAGVAAKLTVFEMCDQYRASGVGLLSLWRAIFRDFDRVLKQHVC